jgi:phage repressor protein C with HTH and peptisase S24 domain
MDNISARLREERERLKLSQTAFGMLAGASKPSQVRYESGLRSPDGAYFAAVAAAGVDILYVLTGRRDDGIMRLQAEATGAPLQRRLQAQTLAMLHPGGQDDDDQPDPAFIPVPLLEARLSAGGGAENGTASINDHTSSVAFPSAWFRRHAIPHAAARLVGIAGDSMEPLLSDGDLAMIDTAHTEVRRGLIYALNDIDGTTRVKHVDLVPRFGLLLRSANPAWPPEPRAGDDANRVTIIGRVVWSGHFWG